MRNKPFYLLLALTLIGFADAAYLTATHYLGQAPICSVAEGCDVVLSSDYATVWGVPVALVGVAYYATLFLLLFYYRATGEKWKWDAFRAVIVAGFLVTAYLVYLQLAVIHAICQYCMLSAGLTTILLATIIVHRLMRKNNPPAERK